MKLEFINGFANTANTCLSFENEGVFLYSEKLNLEFPWGSIKDINVNLFSIVSIETMDGKKYIFGANTGERKILKRVIQYIKPLIKNSKPCNVLKNSELSKNEKNRLFGRGEFVREYPEGFDDIVGITYTKKDNDRVNKRVTVISVLVLVVFILSIFTFIFGDMPSKKNQYDDVFDKDPNKWTEDEKRYVDDLFDWIGEHED